MNHDCDCEYYYDDCCCVNKQEKLNATVLRCGSPGFVAFPNLTGVDITHTIAELQINTSGFEHPCILLSFTANITTGVIGSYRFQIFKQCSGQMAPIPVGGIYEYSRSVATTVSDSFHFNECDCDSCMNDCCTYLVVVTFNVSPLIGGATLSAIITENGRDCMITHQ
ncbi:DUF4489 domain-containing protein [Lacrimispora amygdalina]|uniref:DUF4489 domain-containing protein n=1 Tax=Lacrimispora amygdalina TaxID=253257 RepID=A0A3E2N3S2_9FIRM|nr:DUF4489 domain-containing protein [Clostridium indicum]RFZ75615.1 DUF4489 domain-containing protein [Clostridium indicum]